MPCLNRALPLTTDVTVPLEASSSFRRSGLRDDRRRRLLADDLSETDDASPCRTWPEDGGSGAARTTMETPSFSSGSGGCSILFPADWWC